MVGDGGVCAHPLSTWPLAWTNKKASLLVEELALNVVPLVGFELTTYRLQGGCSTN